MKTKYAPSTKPARLTHTVSCQLAPGERSALAQDAARHGFRSEAAVIRFALKCHFLTAPNSTTRRDIPADARQIYHASNPSSETFIYTDSRRRFWVKRTQGTVDGKVIPEDKSSGDVFPELAGSSASAVAARHARCGKLIAVWQVSPRQAALVAVRESLPKTLAKELI